MSKIRTLTGITTSGIPHLGNYVGAIKPAIEESRNESVKPYYFLADYHALIKTRDPERVHESAMQVAATWLACGLDTSTATFYRQSDIPEIMELNWILSCMCPKGLMNRAHAYKGSVDANVAAGNDVDKGISMGLFSYPVLMSADILAFNAQKVPVGRDQIQHIEMARDIASAMNHHYQAGFSLPEAVVGENVAILQGLDGRKMSKSYDNTIALFDTEKKLKKSINKIKTNLLEPGQPKDADDSTVFQIWQAFASESQTRDMRLAFENGIAWGEAKKQLFELVNEELKGPRELYNALLNDPAHIQTELDKGAQKARAETIPMLDKIRRNIGLRPLA